MKRIILLVVLAVVMGCSRKPVVSTEKSDSIRVVHSVEYREIVRDTTIYTSVPVESREVARCDSSHLETSVAKSFARIEPDGTLHHTLYNKPVALPVRTVLRDSKLSQRSDSVRVKYIPRREVIRKSYIPAFFWGCLVAAVVMAALLLRNFFRR